MELPVEFTDRMRELLGEEYDAFIESYQEPRHHALRLNTLKISPEILRFPGSRMPFTMRNRIRRPGIRSMRPVFTTCRNPVP